MFLEWQAGELEDVTLEDSGCGQDEPSDGEHAVTYETEEAYRSYVIEFHTVPQNSRDTASQAY